MNAKDLLKRVKEDKVKFIALQFSDVTGAVKSVDMPVRRLEGEVIRDSLLHLSGDLDLARGGPPVPVAAQEASRRRSLYFFHSHNEHNKLLDIFDNANVLECYRRSESIVHLTVTKSLWLMSACTTCRRARLVCSGSLTSFRAVRSSVRESRHVDNSSPVGGVPNTVANAAATNSASPSFVPKRSLIFEATSIASRLFQSASACCGTMLSVRR